MDPELVLPAVQKSIADLGVGYLDLYITHWPYAVDPACTVSPAPWDMRRGYSPEAYLKVWRAMEACVDAGVVRHLGCSNMTAKKLHELRAAARIQPQVIQVEMHPFLAQPKLVAYCQKHAIAVTGYCPLTSPGRPDAYREPGDPDALTHPVVVGIAGSTGKSPAQVLLRWAVQRGTAPLPRSTTLSRIEENGPHSLAGWVLTAEQMAALDGLDATAGSVGRIMKGNNFSQEGVDWRTVWDEDWSEPESESESDAAAR